MLHLNAMTLAEKHADGTILIRLASIVRVCLLVCVTDEEVEQMMAQVCARVASLHLDCRLSLQTSAGRRVSTPSVYCLFVVCHLHSLSTSLCISFSLSLVPLQLDNLGERLGHPMVARREFVSPDRLPFVLACTELQQLVVLTPSSPYLPLDFRGRAVPYFKVLERLTEAADLLATFHKCRMERLTAEDRARLLKNAMGVWASVVHLRVFDRLMVHVSLCCCHCC